MNSAVRSETVTLEATDGHRLKGYLAQPTGAVLGSLVVVQEIFGVNGHIRRVCERYAQVGYVALAPALFDRIKAGVELAYDSEGVAREMELKAPVLAHFGERDKGIPLSVPEELRARHPTAVTHVYAAAEHGFNCDERASYHAEAAELARRRSLGFLAAIF
jgi:dienelactone hydrolase